MSKYYQQALVRLVEIAIVQNDIAAGTEAMGKLSATNGASGAVAYVKGKLAFAQAKHDEALAAFSEVPKGSEWELQALYYSGAVQVAKKDLAKATDTYTPT